LPTDMLRIVVHESGDLALTIAINFENGSAVVLGMSGAIAVGAILGVSRSLRRADIESQIDSIRRLLTASTIAWTVGVFQVFFEYRWVSAVMFPMKAEETNKALAEFGSAIAVSVTFAAGSALSLYLVACFLPVAAIIKFRVDQTNQSLAKHRRIPFDASDLWKDALKIVAPVLAAGPLAALFKA